MPSITTKAARPPIPRSIHVSARSNPGDVVGNTAWSTTAPVAAVTRANVWVAAWVSTPMTNAYSSATIGIATEFLPIGDVVSASARKKALRGRPVTGHDPRQRVGQASNQATEAVPGRRRRLDRVDRSREEHPSGATRFMSHTQPDGDTDPVSQHRASHANTYRRLTAI